jgi:hypothetical protein
MVHQNPFGGVNKWGMHVATLAFTPSPYILLQAVTSTPIHTMEVSSSSGRIEKFSRRLGTISLREFKATFSTVVCELELKYGTNYTGVLEFKQLACYVHYEALDVYEQHSSRILGVTQIPIQLMRQPSPSPLKLHYKLPLHIMGLCPIIQIRYLF